MLDNYIILYAKVPEVNSVPKIKGATYYTNRVQAKW